MKPLPSIFDLLQPLLLFCISLSFGSMLFHSCSPIKSKKTTAFISSQNCFLEEEICKPNERWLNADSSLLTNAFQIDPDSPRVLSFRIDRAAVNKILTLSKGLKDSFILRVYMSLDSLDTLKSENISEPNFRPILYLVNTKKNAIQNTSAFKMDYVDINIINYLDTLTSYDDSVSKPDTITTADIALKFIKAWKHLPKDSIPQVFYHDAALPVPPAPDTGRLEFYTFPNMDIRQIIDTLNKYPEDLLYLHLGIDYEQDSIPFRNIIHIDNPKRFAGPIIIDPSQPPFFEFAVPCPKLCGKNLR